MVGPAAGGGFWSGVGGGVVFGGGRAGKVSCGGRGVTRGPFSREISERSKCTTAAATNSAQAPANCSTQPKVTISVIGRTNRVPRLHLLPQPAPLFLRPPIRTTVSRVTSASSRSNSGHSRPTPPPTTRIMAGTYNSCCTAATFVLSFVTSLVVRTPLRDIQVSNSHRNFCPVTRGIRLLPCGRQVDLKD